VEWLKVKALSSNPSTKKKSYLTAYNEVLWHAYVEVKYVLKKRRKLQEGQCKNTLKGFKLDRKHMILFKSRL
jgi:hypothetical protein